MATFYRPRGSKHPAVLWDAARGRALYEFKQGVCETDDPAAVAKMREMGFAEVPVSVQEQIAMDIARDLTMVQPEGPPAEPQVPEEEPELPKAPVLPPLKRPPAKAVRGK